MPCLAIGCVLILLLGGFIFVFAWGGGGAAGIVMGILFVVGIIYMIIEEGKKQKKEGMLPWRPPWISKKGDGNIRFYDDPFWGEATRGPKKKPPWAP
jgi:hypothetical protein